MFEKIDIYDIVTSLLHGTILIAASIFLFPQMLVVTSVWQLPESILVIVFISIAFFVGQIITAVSSFGENIMFWKWCDKPSNIVFKGSFPEKYLSNDLIKLAKNKLQKAFGMSCSDGSLFYKAMCIARKAEGSISERHNRMFAYNRVAFTNILAICVMFGFSCRWGRCASLTWRGIISFSFVLLFMLVIHWCRAKQRAFYFVREVISVSERELSGDNNGIRN